MYLINNLFYNQGLFPNFYNYPSLELSNVYEGEYSYNIDKNIFFKKRGRSQSEGDQESYGGNKKSREDTHSLDGHNLEEVQAPDFIPPNPYAPTATNIWWYPEAIIDVDLPLVPPGIYVPASTDSDISESDTTNPSFDTEEEAGGEEEEILNVLPTPNITPQQLHAPNPLIPTISQQTPLMVQIPPESEDSDSDLSFHDYHSLGLSSFHFELFYWAQPYILNNYFFLSFSFILFIFFFFYLGCIFLYKDKFSIYIYLFNIIAIKGLKGYLFRAFIRFIFF